MQRQTHFALAAALLSSVLLSGCNSSWYSSDNTYWWSNPGSVDLEPSQSDIKPYEHRGTRPPARKIVVSPGYYMSEAPTPEGHADLDKNWINKQKPTDYTIEMGHGARPAEVAKSLYNSPKTQRAAQLRYQENGEIKSTGVYGSYPTREAADAALAKLPQDVRGNAKVSNWSEVQTLTGQSNNASPSVATSTDPNPSRPTPAAVGGEVPEH